MVRTRDGQARMAPKQLRVTGVLLLGIRTIHLLAGYTLL